MKKLYRLVLNSFVGPFLMTFAIALFILLMQFLWKYIDDLVGKGLDWLVIGKLLFYMLCNLVPMALPLAILVSSIMTYGNLGEHYEIVAAKAAGISLTRLLRPLIVTAVFISLSAFLFSNYILPYTNLKAGSLLYDVTNAKPALNIVPGVFYNGIDGYSIRVGKKSNDGQTIGNILIYDHTQGAGNLKMVIADSGRMAMSVDKNYLYVNLYNGGAYEELRNRRQDHLSRPMLRTSFKEELFTFDLSSFKMSRTDENLFKENKQMLSVTQLQNAIDSLEVQLQSRKHEFLNYTKPMFVLNRDSARLMPLLNCVKPENPLKGFDIKSSTQIYENAMNSARTVMNDIHNNANELEMKNENIDRFYIEYYRRFTWSLACFVLFLIGAPLGALIRKGGLGLPILV
mgnify:CR=1 FL=1